MRGRFFGFLAALSLVLFATVLGLWLSSGWLDIWVFKHFEEDVPYKMHNGEILGLINESRFVFLRHSGGGFSFGNVRPQNWFPLGESGWNATYYKWPASDPALPPGWNAGGRPSTFRPPEYQVLHETNSANVGAMRISDWELALQFILLPFIWSVMKVNRRIRVLHDSRMGLTLCRKCGYDLRASPERCPECGTPAAKRVA
jgi:hypothetical protein